MTQDASGNYYEKSLVNRRNGEITLRVQTRASPLHQPHI